ncbi:MAG: Rrf2 family transcriptional regulator [Ignavibacteriae bacterium]|nr:Rrf2 family transcriptional regulator [Ignavibacteriota bacterium]
MVRLSKKVEYGLIAIRHVATRSNGELVTAKEIADRYHIPYELLAKVLQKLSKAGLIVSHQGVRGGYTLAKHPSEIRVSKVINAIEGTLPMIAQCMSEGPESCGVFSVCTIKSPLHKVQANIEQAFNSMTLMEIV